MSFPLKEIEAVANQVAEQLAPYCEALPASLLGGTLKEGVLLPACVVAGSIRRRRAQCSDIDIVAIPRLETVKTGLFSEGAREPLAASEFYRALTLRVLEGVRGENKWLRGYVRATLGVSGAWKRPPVPCDVYIATRETWATLLLIRTGSAAHNVFLCSRAREMGGILHANGDGLELPGDYDPIAQSDPGTPMGSIGPQKSGHSGPRRRIVPQSEDEIFAALLDRDHIRALRSGPGYVGSDRPEAIWLPPELRECNQRRVPVWMDSVGRRT